MTKEWMSWVTITVSTELYKALKLIAREERVTACPVDEGEVWVVDRALVFLEEAVCRYASLRDWVAPLGHEER